MSNSIETKIIGVGSYLPENKVSNHDLEEILDTSDEWIRQRTGIETRHWADTNTATSDLALKASLEAIDHAGIKKEDIDFILVASCSADADIPGVSCFLQAKLDLATVCPR